MQKRKDGNMPNEKTCTKYGETKSLPEFSFRDKAKGTYYSRCKACVAAYRKVYYAKNYEKLKAYREKNAEKRKPYFKAYYRNNIERLKAYHRRYHRENSL